MSVTQDANELISMAEKLRSTHQPHFFCRNQQGELREFISFPYPVDDKVLVMVRAPEAPASMEAVEALSVTPELLSVKSSRVAGIGYDAIAETIKVRFTNGTEYEYYRRAVSVWMEFQAAPSKGSFIAKVLTPGKDYKRIK